MLTNCYTLWWISRFLVGCQDDMTLIYSSEGKTYTKQIYFMDDSLIISMLSSSIQATLKTNARNLFPIVPEYGKIKVKEAASSQPLLGP